MGKRIQPKEQKMEPTKAVATKAKAELVNASDVSAWGTREIRSTSVIIPRILKIEPMSDMAIDGKAKVGEFRDSLTGEKVGSLTEPFEFVPIEVEEKWAVFTVTEIKGKKKREFSEMLPVTAQNENMKYAEGDIERDRI